MIRVIDGNTLETVKRYMFVEHNPKNATKIADELGTLINMDLSSDCLYLATYADGSVYGFSFD